MGLLFLIWQTNICRGPWTNFFDGPSGTCLWPRNLTIPTKHMLPLNLINKCMMYFIYCVCIAHSPDNSFMGFVVEQHLNDSDVKGIKRENWALIYGKNDYMYEVMICFINCDNYCSRHGDICSCMTFQILCSERFYPKYALLFILFDEIIDTWSCKPTIIHVLHMYTLCMKKWLFAMTNTYAILDKMVICLACNRKLTCHNLCSNSIYTWYYL